MNNSHLSNGNILKLEKGSVLFVEGEASDFIYLVKSGKIGLFKEGGNRLISKGFVLPKDIIGELHLLNNDLWDNCAIALEKSDIVPVKKSELSSVIESCPKWINNIMHTITDRLKSTIEVLKEHRIEDELDQTQILDSTFSEELLEAIRVYRNNKS